MISENEINLAAKKLKNNKSSAYDMIKNEMIKSAFPFLSKSITHAFNMILSTGKFPKSWKEGIVSHFIKMVVNLTQTIIEVLH